MSPGINFIRKIIHITQYTATKNERTINFHHNISRVIAKLDSKAGIIIAINIDIILLTELSTINPVNYTTIDTNQTHNAE